MKMRPIFTIERMSDDCHTVLQKIYVYPDGHVESEPFEKIFIRNDFPLCCIPKIEEYLMTLNIGKEYDKPEGRISILMGYPHMLDEIFEKEPPDPEWHKIQRQEADSPSFVCGLVERIALNKSKNDCADGKSSG